MEHHCCVFLGYMRWLILLWSCQLTEPTVHCRVYLKLKLLCINFLFIELLRNYKQHCSLSHVVENRHTMILHSKNIQYFLKFCYFLVHHDLWFYLSHFCLVVQIRYVHFLCVFGCPSLVICTDSCIFLNKCSCSVFVFHILGNSHLSCHHCLWPWYDHGLGFLPLFVPVLW